MIYPVSTCNKFDSRDHRWCLYFNFEKLTKLLHYRPASMADNLGPGPTFLMSEPKPSQFKVITQVEESSTLR